MNKPVCIVAGVGDGNGFAIAREQQQQGYFVVTLARNEDKLKAMFADIPADDFAHIGCDLTDSDSIESMYQIVKEKYGNPEVLIYNAGNALFDSVEIAKLEEFESAIRLNCSGLLKLTQTMLPDFESANSPAVIVIGATAALRGTPRTLSFSSAKSAQLVMVESMAKSLWPKGIHVSYVIIDGVVKTSVTTQFFKDKDDDFFIKPEDIATRVAGIIQEPNSAWSFKVEIRPFQENW